MGVCAWRLMMCVSGTSSFFSVEVRAGIEPAYKGFADPCLTTWLPDLRMMIERSDLFLVFFNSIQIVEYFIDAISGNCSLTLHERAKAL